MSPPEPRADETSPTVTTCVAVAIALALALWDTRFHVVPSENGVWRGMSGPPSVLRVVLSLGAGLAAAFATRKAPRRWRTPLIGLALAGAPLIPVYTGHALPLLALQGPVLSFVAGGAIALALARRMAAGEPGHVPGLLLFGAAFAFYAALAARIPGPAGPQGDEPHYLTMAQSLWSDRDLDLTDEFANAEYSRFYAGTLSGHVSENSPPGTAYSIHSPGLALLILPAYAAGGHRGAQLVLAALAALAGVLVHRVVRAAIDERTAAIAWALFAFTPPVPIYAVTLYPETPALAALAYFLWTGRGRPGWREALGAAATAGALAWLHSKFVPLGALGLAFTLLRPCAARVRAAAVAVFVAMVGGMLAYFQARYGQASLFAAIGPADLDLQRLPRHVVALFFDRQFGLFAIAPVWLMALPGAVLLFKARTGDAIRALVLASVPIAAGAAYVGWWGGSAPPARYVIPALPAIALAAAPAFRARKDMAVVLGACGLVLVGLAADAPRILHNRGDGESLLLRNLAPAVDLDALLPSFFDHDAATLILTLTLLAAFALFWRFRLVGLVAGATAYILVAGTLRDGPLVDRRLATEDVIDRWEPGRWSGPMGPPSLRTLAMPLELQRGPWVLAAGEQRNSRRTGLPPGAYRVELRASAVEPGTVPDGGLRVRGRAAAGRGRPHRGATERGLSAAAPGRRASARPHRHRGGGPGPARRRARGAGGRRSAKPPRRVSVPAARDRRALPRGRSARARHRRGSERAGRGRVPSRRRGGGVPGRRPFRGVRAPRGATVVRAGGRRGALGRTGRAPGLRSDVGLRASAGRRREPGARERRGGAGARAGRVGPVQRGRAALRATGAP